MEPCENIQLKDLLEFNNRDFGHFYDLIEDLRRSVAFLSDKCDFWQKNYLIDPKVIEDYLKIINLEMTNIITKSENAFRIRSSAILPITKRRIDLDDFDADLARLDMCFQKRTQLRHLPSFEEYRNLEHEIYESLYACNNLVSDDDQVVPIFGFMLESYQDDYGESIKIFIDDIDSICEAKKQLRKDFENSIAVRYWNLNGRDIFKTVIALRNEGAIELDLLPLLEFISKYDAIQQIKEKEPNSGIHIHTDKIEIKEAGDIITEGGVKNVNNNKK